ncbi:MAG: hypothetical protein KIC77_09805 [Clostridiales bacterium]|jgi:hypothetical protein fulcA4_08092|nr:hypothetical protein [Clostridiales bacterium]
MSKIAIIMTLPAEYNTSSMIRCRGIINSWANQGHDIKCYMPNADKNSKYFSNGISLEGIDIMRFGKIIQSGEIAKSNAVGSTSLKGKIKGILYRMFKKLDVFGSTLLYLPDRKKISDDIRKNRFDILITFSDPMTAHMLGKYCKRHNKGIYYIQQWGDPLASDTISKIAQPVWLRKIIENSLIKSASRICYVSPFTCEEQKKIFPKQAGKMIFLPTPSVPYNESAEIRQHNSLCLGYFGSYNSVARNLIPFYEAVKECPDVTALIIGDSDLRLQETSNIKVLQRVSQEELSKHMANIDVIVCLMNIKGNQIPGKVYHDASSTKDIMFIKDGEYGDQIETFFERYQHYTFVCNDKEAIKAAIKNYIVNGVPIRKPVEAFMASSIATQLISH